MPGSSQGPRPHAPRRAHGRALALAVLGGLGLLRPVGALHCEGDEECDAALEDVQASEDRFDHDGASDPNYWDNIYRIQGAHGRTYYEWYDLGFADLKETFARHFIPQTQILVVGSGDSELSVELDAAGWDVKSIDFSAEANAHMRELHPTLEFLTMDARNMSFPDRQFGAVIDKGLLDCLRSEEDQLLYFRELRRVLIPGGTMVVTAMRSDMSTYIGTGWECEPQVKMLGPSFIETDVTSPPSPMPGTAGTVPYYVSICKSDGE